jgi:hypothetical protein
MDDGYSQLGHAWQRIDKLETALRLIVEKRTDGVLLLTREACQLVAAKALTHG